MSTSAPDEPDSPQPRRTPNPILLTSRPQRERVVWALGLLLMIGGFLLNITVTRPVGLAIGVPGMLIVIVIVVRALLYREERGPTR